MQCLQKSRRGLPSIVLGICSSGTCENVCHFELDIVCPQTPGCYQFHWEPLDFHRVSTYALERMRLRYLWLLAYLIQLPCYQYSGRMWCCTDEWGRSLQTISWLKVEKWILIQRKVLTKCILFAVSWECKLLIGLLSKGDGKECIC